MGVCLGGATVELMCTEIRHLARSELGEAEEPFRIGQKAVRPCRTSAIRFCPNVSAVWLDCCVGIGCRARGRGAVHERDISHSSVERVALPDASLLACYLLRKATGLAAGLVINADRAKENLTQAVTAWSSVSRYCWRWCRPG